MSIICQTFVQNAWRSDLCSNCFKSLDDHSESVGMRGDRMSSQRYVPQAASLYQSRGISTSLKWRLSEPIYERVARRDFASQTPPKAEQKRSEGVQSGKGILIKNPDRKLKSRSSVDFASEEALVIGYGGNDYDSDLSPWEMGSDDGSIDFDILDDTDEDRKITKLTKNNTEFNSSNQNLLPSNNSARRSNKEEEKLNSINNYNNNKPSTRSPDKTLNITYNNIQIEKKLNQYYYPSSTETLKTYLQNNNSIGENISKSNNEQSKPIDNTKVENCKRETSRIADENCKILLNEDFSPLNTRTYSFVSELNKNNTSSEHSSDSDYSTCRLTAGESTDSESFQDADESRIEPCPSFLHGNFPKSLSHTAIRELECDKKYDGGSSTSGDVSNLSDDSDTHEFPERNMYKAKVIRTTKNSSDLEIKNFSKEHDVTSALKQEATVSPGRKNIQIRFKDPATESSKDASVTQKVEECDVKICSSESPQNSSMFKIIKNPEDVVSISVDSKENSPAQRCETNDFHKIEPVSKISLGKCATSPAVNDSSVPKKRPDKKVNIKTTPANPKQMKGENGIGQKQSQKTSLHNQEVTMRHKNIDQSNAGGIRNSSSIDKGQSDYDDGTDCEASPDTIAHRQSKLAALALELELARRDSARPNSVNIPSTVQAAPPQLMHSSCTTSPPEHCTPAQKSSTLSCSSRPAPLPDVLQETPTKAKKSRFSLKKLLKRSKESSTFSPTVKEPNPKAWKKHTFDRSRLSLEIVHPMDLTSDPGTSGDSTPTDENIYAVSNHPGKGLFRGYNRAKSLSALPISGGLNEQSNCSLLDCRKVETLPARKAGTVAERKKNRPSLVRTPSCSALPNRTQPDTPARESVERVPPPKPPPPPPKHKVQHPPPPPPPHLLRCAKQPSNSPARPPPPKIPESKLRTLSSHQETNDYSNSDKEYANLGDIRSQLMPKKPQRPSAVSVARESETDDKKTSDDLYETLQAADEEDHYTYLDDSEMKASKGKECPTHESVSRFKTSGEQSPRGRPWLDLQTSYSAIAATNYESLAELITSSLNEIPEYLKKAGKSMKFKDFILENESPQIILQNRIIYNALFKNHEQEKIMLLIVPRKPNSCVPRYQARYPVLAGFSDYIPKHEDFPIRDVEFASVYILQRSSISTVHQFVKNTSMDKSNQHIHLRNYCFVLLQLIHTLKSLQAEGIEEVNFDLEHLILVTTHEEKPPIFVLFPEDKSYLTFSDTVQSRKTLCQATLVTMFHFLNIKQAEELENCFVNGELLAEPVAHTFSAIAKVLLEEKASSLTQAKGYLEYMLWGPVDVAVSDSQTNDLIETILQRWLDLQRAQMVKSTISQLQPKSHTPSQLHVFEEYQLIFLLQASVKSLKTVISKL